MDTFRLLTPEEQGQAGRLLDILSKAAGLMDGGINPGAVVIALIDVLIKHAEAEGYVAPPRAEMN